MRTGFYFAILIAGSAIGSVITWRLAKKKYEKIAQEEIDSVKEAFARRESHSEAKGTVKKAGGIRCAAEQAKEKPDIREYAEMIRQAGYALEGSADIMGDKHPYVITPEEFGEFDDYETISLTWYADEILAEDNGEIVDDVEDIVGDALSHFGEYEDDSVFVRCDERKCDYEILLDRRYFSDVAGSGPRRVEVR